MKRKKTVIIPLVIILILGLGIIGAYKYMNRSKKADLSATDSELNVNEETAEKSREHNIENILFLGVDKEEDASDSIMVLSLDKDDNRAKLTSIMRDTYVDLGPGTVTKINYAYHYGGAAKSIQVINDLFSLDINKYVKVDFEGLSSVIDDIGGITVNLAPEESAALGFKNSGNVNLNGAQALKFSRLRRIDSDYERTSRQREVMMAVLTKLKSLPVTQLPGVISAMSSNVETNLKDTEMMSMAKYILSLDTESLSEFRIPMDGSTSESQSGIYYLYWDKDANTSALHNFIYGE